MAPRKSTLLSLLAVCCVLVSGCTVADPFGEVAGAPPEPSALYQGEPEPRPRVSTPRLKPRHRSDPLSLAHCIYIALENNPQTRVSWRATQAGAAAVGRARGQFFPELNFTSSFQRQKVQVLTEVEDQFLRTTHRSNFGLTQLLLDGGSRSAQLEAAMADLRVADFRHNSTLLDVVARTEVAYYRLLSAKSLLSVAADTLKQRSRHAQLARSRYRAGMAREVEALQAEAEQADARLALVEARNRVRTARGRLASTMGLPVTADFEVRQIPETLLEVERKDVEALLAEAAEKRPALKSAAAEVNRLREVVNLREAGRWPNLNASLIYGWRAKHTADTEAEEYTLDLSLEWPLFTGFQRSYNIREAEAQLQRAIARYENELQGVELDVWEAYSELIRADEAIQAAKVFVDSARVSLQASERAYQAGRATITELIDAQTTLTRARNRRETARLEWYIAIVRLDRVVGRVWRHRPPGRGEPPDNRPYVTTAAQAPEWREGPYALDD